MAQKGIHRSSVGFWTTSRSGQPPRRQTIAGPRPEGPGFPLSAPGAVLTLEAWPSTCFGGMAQHLQNKDKRLPSAEQRQAPVAKQRQALSCPYTALAGQRQAPSHVYIALAKHLPSTCQAPAEHLPSTFQDFPSREVEEVWDIIDKLGDSHASKARTAPGADRGNPGPSGRGPAIVCLHGGRPDLEVVQNPALLLGSLFGPRSRGGPEPPLYGSRNIGSPDKK